MKPYFLFIFGLLLISCSSKRADKLHDYGETTYPAKPEINRIDGTSIAENELTSKIQQLTDAAKVTGLGVTIFNNNEIVLKKAFGKANYDYNDSLRTNDVFSGASLSKAVFGYLVAGLAEEGIIDLDKPLQEYLDVPIPEIPFEKEWRGFKDISHDKRYKNITARMCMSHSTGLPNWRWISRIGDFDRNGKLQIYFDPGTQYSYSGEGIMLLQYVIEHVTGTCLEKLARERIFGPLKMNMTSYVWQDRFEDRYCQGHTIDQEVIPKDTKDEAGAAGSIETTLDDYSKFVQHILELTAAKSNVTDRMFTPNIRIHSKAQFGPSSLEKTSENDNIGLSYGLGWGLLNSPFGYGAFKEGHDEGFQHYSIIFPEQKIGVILLSNSDNAESIFKELLQLTIGDVYTPWRWENYIPYDDIVL